MPDSMQESDITKVINALIGPINPTGDCFVDSERHKNLETLIKVMDHQKERLKKVAAHADALQDSVQAMGEKAKLYLASWEAE